jgi:hypothetical protein|tara:strand:- start:231 stop:620 length:390 start_codon:yes stop_codon:yes gene_type:complete
MKTLLEATKDLGRFVVDDPFETLYITACAASFVLGIALFGKVAFDFRENHPKDKPIRTITRYVAEVDGKPEISVTDKRDLYGRLGIKPSSKDLVNDGLNYPHLYSLPLGRLKRLEADYRDNPPQSLRPR